MDALPNTIMWWGYLHSTGTIQLKRWFGDHQDYTTDCQGNEFVVRVVEPFACPSCEEAMVILKQRLGKGPQPT